MDRFASNTLRTLAVIGAAVFVIVGSLVLLLIGLCFKAAARYGGPTDTQDLGIYYAAIAIDVVFVIGGIIGIAIMARRLFRANMHEKDYSLVPPYPLVPSGATPQLSAHTIPDVIAHLSPASASAIQQLAVAIAAKIAAEVLLGLVGWYGALGLPRAPFPLYQIGFVVWGLAAIAPHLILLYYLARKPGPTVFAYALVIPSIHLLLGIFGHSAFLAFVLRAGQFAAPLLSIIPWILDIAILYLAWKAIRRTGIQPDPVRLIVAAVVIFLYTSLLPVLVLVLNYLHR